MAFDGKAAHLSQSVPTRLGRAAASRICSCCWCLVGGIDVDCCFWVDYIVGWGCWGDYSGAVVLGGSWGAV